MSVVCLAVDKFTFSDLVGTCVHAGVFLPLCVCLWRIEEGVSEIKTVLLTFFWNRGKDLKSPLSG